MRGIRDTAALFHQAAHVESGDAINGSRRQLYTSLRTISSAARQTGETPTEWGSGFARIEQETGTIADLARTIAAEDGLAADSDFAGWAALLHRDVASHARDIDELVPWVRKAADRTLSGIGELAIAPPRLIDAEQICDATAAQLDTVHEELVAHGNTAVATLMQLDASARDLRASATACAALVQRVNAIADRAHTLVRTMDFSVLFDQVRKLFAIGLRVADGTLDTGLYDLLASEARLTSFVAIAKGDVPVSHWFHLGRALTPVGKDSILISWSGSMFEYLMPSLIMQVPEGGLLDQTCRLMVRHQIAYGNEQGVPWGISESGFNARDIEMTYQYSTFGAPGLGLRRRVGEDLVIAPYATGLAAMIDPVAATKNFRRLADAGADGAYGFHEALDFTPSRVPTGATVAIVRSYMAHHQGMIVLGIADALLDGIMRRRFHGEPIVRASELLLQERTPRDVAVARPQIDTAPLVRDVREPVAPIARRFVSPHSAVPRTHLLSNGQYSVMLTAVGSGYSRWRDLAVTRWREDTTCDAAGTYLYLRDVTTGATWSATYHPAGNEPDAYSVTFSEDRAEYVRRDGAIATRLEVVVSPEDDAEVRRVTITNHGMRVREIEVTSYAEVVLAPQGADVAHPAFSDLFVRTECVPDSATLLATRRPRSATEGETWLAHVLAVSGETIGALQWETDRARFLGRGRGIRAPLAITLGQALSNTVGSVLDPVMSLRRRVRLRPGGRAQLTFTTIAATSREKLLDLADRYHESSAFERAADLAWTQAQVQLRHLGVTPDEAHLFQSLASTALYANRGLRPSAATLARPNKGRGALWAHGISGDLPIIVVQIDDLDDIGLVRQLLRAQEYWRAKRLAIDLVVLNEHGASYLQDLQVLLETLARASQPVGEAHERGSVFVLRADRVQADRDALMFAARAVLSGRRGTLADQVLRAYRQATSNPELPQTRSPSRREGQSTPVPELQLFNGLGGFSPDGREYVVVLSGEKTTPAPWINVISNPDFGFQVSESGSGTPGRSTAMRTRSRHGRTIRSTIPPVKCSTSAMTTTAMSGRRRRCQFARPARRTSRVTARAIPDSNTARGASGSSSCNSFRCTTRSRSHA